MTHEIVRAKSAPIIEPLAKISEVEGILCFGSYAMGTADEHSDLDLYVLCDTDVVPAPVRWEVLGKIPTVRNLEIGHIAAGWEQPWCPQTDRCRIGDLQFDVVYNTVDWLCRVVRAVKAFGIPPAEFGFRAYTVLGLLEHSITLHDPHGTLQALKASLYPYPSKLKEALVSQNLSIARGSLEDLRDYIRRSIGNTAFHFHYERLMDSLGTMLFAINERHDPATKRTEEALRNLTLLPDRFLERYDRILVTPLTPEGRAEIVRSFETLLGDVEGLLNGWEV
jgi:hypothetical protein